MSVEDWKDLGTIKNRWCETNDEYLDMALNLFEKIYAENKKLKEFAYKFLDDCDEEEQFTLEEYLELSNKVYDLEQGNEKLKNEKRILEQQSGDLLSRIFKVKDYINKGCEGHDYYEYDYILELLEGVE